MRRPALIRSLLLCLCLAAPAPAAAQSSPYAPVLTVNGRPVTAWELDQRTLFLQLLGAQGDIRAEAERALIEDRLRQEAAKKAGITLNSDQVMAGMTEFAGRANLTPEQFTEAIGQAGIAPETFRDFVSAGLLWREVVRARFAGRISVSDAEVDRALSLTAKRGEGPRVLISEILLPGSGAQLVILRDEALILSEEIRAGASFADLAREHSAAPSRENGGALGWMPLTNLPANARAAIAVLQPGQVSEPVPVPGGVALFQLRDVSQGGDIQSRNIRVDYAEYLIPGGRNAEALAEAERVRVEVDTCDDLYTVARGQPAERLRRETVPLASVPGDVAGELAAMDEGDTSTAVSRGGNLIFLMLCSRTATAPEGSPLDFDAATLPAPEGDQPRIREDLGFSKGPSREAVRNEIINQRVAGLADAYLAELIADAEILRP
jgi:peptidyl-prolyl cis-trans isomerase SurA